VIPEAQDLRRNVSRREADFKKETSWKRQVLLLNSKSSAVQVFKLSFIFP